MRSDNISPATVDSIEWRTTGQGQPGRLFLIPPGGLQVAAAIEMRIGPLASFF